MMATYSLAKLWQLWKQEGVTVDQVIGYLLQNLVTLEQRVQALEKRLKALEQGGKP